MHLYTYFRSSASWRTRIALALKNIEYTPAFVHLLRHGGEQLGAEYGAINPAALVPSLRLDDGRILTQSLAIIEWLDENYPLPPLLPLDSLARAQVRAFALTIACEVHPLNNLRVLRYLKREVGADDATRDRWYAHWIAMGLTPLEGMLKDMPGPFCFGATPGLADIFLVPQLANARRMNCPLDSYPRLLRAEAAAMAHPAFQDTAPDRQPDAS